MRPIILLSCFLLALSFSLEKGRCQESEATLPVFTKGRANIYLDIKPPSDEALKAAVEDFRRSFQLMAGAELPVSVSGSAIPVRFNITVPVGAQLTKEQGAAWGDSKITVEPTQIVIESVSAMGIANGLYTLLDRWGCRWVMPGPIGECIPKLSELTLPLGIIDGKLSTDMRVKTFHGGAEGKEWARRNRNLYQRYLPTDHNWTGPGPGAIVPPAIYNDPAQPETYHPEYYALVGGKRTPTQICTTNPDVIKLAMKAADKFFAERPHADSFPVEPNDTLEFCQCEKCVALDPEGQDADGLPLVTDRVIIFANEVARELRKKYPGKYVGLFAYNNHSLPPVKVKPEPEVLVSVCRSNFDMYRLTPQEEGDSASKFYKLISDWKKLGVTVFTYEYNPIYWNANLFCPNYLDLAQTVKDTMKLGSIGTYTDGMIYYDNATNFLDNYLLFRLSADVSLDPKKELLEMCETFYGPASQAMNDYYLTMAETSNYKTPNGALFGGGFRYFYTLFNPDMIQRARKHLEAALQTAPADSIYRKRVELADLNQQYLDAYVQGVWKAQAGDYEGSVAEFDRMEALIAELAKNGLIVKDNVFNEEETLRRVKGIRLAALAESFAEKLGMVTSWKMLGPFNNSDRGAELKTDAFEPLKSIDQSVKLADGKLAEWRTVESPSGFLDFRKAFGKVDPDWLALYTYVGVKVTTTEKKRVEFRMDSFNSFRVFLNGKEVYYRPGCDLDFPDKNKVPIILEEGENVIVFKCTHIFDNYAFPWGLYFRITKPNGDPVTGLTYSL